MGRAALSLATGLALWACAGEGGPSATAELEQAMQEARSHRARSSYDPWPEVLEDRQQVLLALRRCDEYAAPRTLRILVRLDAAGEPERVLVDPRTRYTRCLAAEVERARFRPPPQPGWWTELRFGVE